MADTSTFMPVGELPVIDYGAVYRNAKARRELEEEKKLAYLNQFQQERGSFTSGLQDQLQMEWDAIEADLDQGDMSFEAKARRQKLYNTYKQHAADALTYAETINNLEASVLADPTQYNDPTAIMQQLEQARAMPLDLNMIGNAVSQLPRLGEFRRFALPEIAPNAAAGMILENLKASGGYQNFYDMAGEGALDPEAVANSVSAWFGANSLSQEEEDQAIAYVLHQLGGLSGNMEDLSKIRNLDDAQREEYIGLYAQYVTKSLNNMLATDIETAKEKEQREYNLYRRKLNAQASIARRQAEAKEGANTYGISTGDLSYAPAITETGPRGNVIKTGEPDLENAGFVVHSKIEGTQPSYRDERGNLHYITSIGYDQTGNPYAVVRSSQDVIEKGNARTHLAHEVIPMNEIPLTGLSNAKQAQTIQNTFNRMLPYYQQAVMEMNPGKPAPGPAGLAQSQAWLMNAEPDRDAIDANISQILRAESPAPKSSEELSMPRDKYSSMSDEEKINYFVDYAISNGALQGGYAQYEKLSPEQKAEVAIQGMNAIFRNDDLPGNILGGDNTSLWYLTEDELRNQMKSKSIKDQRGMTDNSRAFLMQ